MNAPVEPATILVDVSTRYTWSEELFYPIEILLFSEVLRIRKIP